MRVRGAARVVVALGAALVLAGCAPGTVSGRASSEAPTRATLLHVATRFNDDYAANRDGPVYDRWDAVSRRLISRADYLRRHRECPTPPGRALVEGATRGPDGYWRVYYEIAGVRLTDYWHYQRGRWTFNLARSNPRAVALYRLSFAAYAAAVGCGRVSG